MILTNSILNNLAQNKIVVVKDFLKTCGVVDHLARSKKLAEYILELDQNQSLHAAGISKNTSVEKKIRGDFIYWLPDFSVADQRAQYFIEVLENIRKQLNEEFYLGLKDFEAMLALYKNGAHYDKHLDQFKTDGARKITFIYYLNENWNPAHGGQLHVFKENDAESLLMTVEPTMGTLVLFRSDVFWHEVARANAPRLSLTGWFRT